MRLKYNETVAAEKAYCKRPKEYCKFRTQCIIHFMGDENISSNSEEVSTEEDSMLTLQFDKGNGLLPAIVQDHETKEVLMLAYVNDLAWKKTLETGKAHYWSRSRNKLWLKGETSGHLQIIRNILVDCDDDNWGELPVIPDTGAVFSGKYQKINLKQ
jgi:phosphoribosyl-AMP cyclohydrolase